MQKTLSEHYKELYPIMLKLAKSKIREKFNAPDIVQDCFVKYLEYEKDNPSKSLSPYLLKKSVLIACKKDNEESSKKIHLD